MRVYEYGDPKAEIVLIQPTGAHELAELESEVAEIGRLTGVSFWFLAYPVNDWNCALSPGKRLRYLAMKASEKVRQQL